MTQHLQELKKWIRDGVSKSRPVLTLFPDHWRPNPNTSVMEPTLPDWATPKG